MSGSTLRRTGGVFGLAIALAGTRCTPYEGPDAPEAQGEPASPETLAELGSAGAPDAVPPPAPPLVLSAADQASFAPLPARPDAIPVLLFHGICPTTCVGNDPLQLPRAELARIMLMLGRAGYTTISIDAYSRFMAGDKRGLPVRPILVTFDDGRSDAYLGAHAILVSLGARATMFVVPGRPETSAVGFMRWPDIRAALATGRWDVQVQAGSASEAETDIAAFGPLMTARVHNYYRPSSFSVPFGDYGQVAGGDPTIARSMRTFLDGHFDYWFTQPAVDPDFTVPGGDTHERRRFTVLGSHKAEDVYAWLKTHASPPVAPSGPRWTSPAWIDYNHNGPAANRLPEYSSAGYHRGDLPIPTKQSLVVEATAFGAIPNDEGDDTAALQAALDHVGQLGGGVVHLPAGRFIVHPTKQSPSVTIRHDNVVLRGSGSGPAGTVLYLGAPGEFDKNTVFPRAGSSVDDPQKQAAIAIIGSAARTELARYTAPTLRGSDVLHVTTTSELHAGQTIEIELKSATTDVDPDLPHVLVSPASIFPDKEYDTVSKFGQTISWLVEVEAVLDPTTVRLTQPVRFDHTLAHDARIYSFNGVAGSGLEHLRFDSAWAGGFSHHKPFPWTATGSNIIRTITEQDYLWSAIWVDHARDGWMTDVTISNYTQGINFSRSTAFTVDGTRREGLDGHAGIHMASSHNILVRNYEVASHIVHFLTIEAWASGNVITKSRCDQLTTDLPTQTGPFIDFHGLFAYENLIENTVGCYLFPGGDRQVLPQAGIRNTFWNMEVPVVMDRLGGPFLNEFFRSDSWDLTAGHHPLSSYEHYPQSFVVAPFRSGLPVRVAGSSADRKDSWLTLEGLGKRFVNPSSLYAAQVERRRLLAQ